MLSCTRGGSGWIFGKLPSLKGRLTLGHTAQGNGEITIARNVLKTNRSGTSLYGLANMVVFSKILDLMTWRSFQTLLILWFVLCQSTQYTGTSCTHPYVVGIPFFIH